MARITDRQRRMREDVREKIQAGWHYSRIIAFLEMEEAPADPQQLALLKAQVDTHFKVLNKVLPDLKAMEHSGEVNLTAHEEWLDELDD